MRDQLRALLLDDDGDGVPNPNDRCTATPASDVVDGEGCSLAAFCARFATKRLCSLADWRNDEPRRPADCGWQREYRPR